MSEFMNARNGSRDFRWQLLTTVSSLALLASVYGPNDASADEAVRPTIWVELGGQLEQLQGQGQTFTAPFLTQTPTPAPFLNAPPIHAEKAPLFANGAQGKLLFEPEGSDWVFSASVRYGRSNGARNLLHRTPLGRYHIVERTLATIHTPGGSTAFDVTYADRGYRTPVGGKFVGVQTNHRESHAVLDFQAGKDIGIGIFGRESTSVFSLGVRFAQFTSASSVNVGAQPTIHLTTNRSPTRFPNQHLLYMHFNLYNLSGHSERSFHGVGPSISWNASAPFLGNPERAEFAIDWGANAAILFGKQKASVQHNTYERYCRSAFCEIGSTGGVKVPPTILGNGARNSVRSVTVPNVGGFAGMSLNFPNAKVSLGYRADFFFGAVDTGIDTRKEGTLGFMGPFATISVGLGG